jgi:hypothetical protein
MRRLVSRARSVANRATWREAMQHRTSAIARILRVLPSCMLASMAERTKGPNGWLISATGADGVRQVVLEVMTGTKAHAVEDLGMPIPVHVHRTELIDVARLEELLHDGSVTVVFVEAGS